MSRRAFIALLVIGVLAIAALLAVYFSGLIIVGDPFPGVWNVEGKPSDTGMLIKRMEDGYVFTALVAGEVVGWRRLERRGRILVGQYPDSKRVSFAYQPWDGHLVWTNWDGGDLRGHLELSKAADGAPNTPSD